MNYREAISQSINFIELNIKDDLAVEKIASHVGYSMYHFCRVFALSQGISVMEYVRKRRLSLARTELLHKKIIDVAVLYGFETSSGFSKSFKKQFGYSSLVYLKHMNNLNTQNIINDIGGYTMNPIFVKRPAFKVAGYGIKSDIITGYTKDIAAYWTNYNGDENLETKMYNILNPKKHGEVGICITSENTENLTYLLGVIVEDFSYVTEDMITVEVPEACYAVFTTPQVDTTDKSTYDNVFSTSIRNTYKYIFDEWFESSGYVYDESKIDFEFYDERCHFKPDTTMDIFIPVKKL